MRVLPLLLLVACGAPARQPVDISCREISREVLTGEEDLGGGHTAGDLAASLPGDHEGQLTWDGGEQAALRVSVAGLGDIVRITRTPGDPSLSSDGLCDPLVTAPATITFRTGDGAFDETAPVDVEITAEGTTFAFDVDLGQVRGSWEPRPGDMEPGETGALTFTGTLGPDGSASGEVLLFAHSCDGEACGGHGGPIAAWSL